MLFLCWTLFYCAFRFGAGTRAVEFNNLMQPLFWSASKVLTLMLPFYVVCIKSINSDVAILCGLHQKY
jgi:hypothetical protein